MLNVQNSTQRITQRLATRLLNPDKTRFMWLGGRLLLEQIDRPTVSPHLRFPPHPVFLLLLLMTWVLSWILLLLSLIRSALFQDLASTCIMR